MRRVRVLLRSHPLLGVGLVCVSLAAAWIAIAEVVSDYPPGTVEIGEIHDLEEWFRDQQLKWLAIAPPTEDPLMQTGYPSVLPFDAMEFPKPCKKGLVGDIEYGVPVYDVTLVEDPATREFVIFNTNLEEVCSLAAPADYDPEAFAKGRYPGLYSGDYTAGQIAWILDLYDPARIQISVRLVPVEFFETYLEAAETAAALASMSMGGMSMMMEGGAGIDSNRLWITAQAPTAGSTNNVEVTVHLPSGFTNDIDVFSCDEPSFDGMESEWVLAASNLSAGGQSSVVWTNLNATNYFKVYTAGNADLDGDTDGLIDGRELLLHKTDPELSDTDFDGASDGEEVAAGTDPLNNPGDADGDGLSDDHEIVLGTSTNSADTDLDWFSDGYEVAEQTGPLDSNDTPRLDAQINDGSLYVGSASLQLWVDGVVAEQAIVDGSALMSNPTTNNLTYPLLHTLADSGNGARALFVRFLRAAGSEESILFRVPFMLDTTPPQIQVSEPIDDLVTSRRWVRVAGSIGETGSYASVFVDEDRVNSVSQGNFEHSRYALTEGTNVLSCVAVDAAGHASTQTVTVIQDLSIDTQAPEVHLDLPRDFEVSGGSTNWFDRTTFGSNEQVFVKGWTDDETAEITLFASQAGQTGPFVAASVLGTDVWARVDLFPGTNDLAIGALDAAGNSSWTNYTVVRDESFFILITNPAPYLVMNVASTLVSGVASPQFTGATISVNGVLATITDHGSNVTFETSPEIALSAGPTQIEGMALLNGRSHYFDPQVFGYETASLVYSEDTTRRITWFYSSPTPEYEDIATNLYCDTWDANSRTYRETLRRIEWSCDYTGGSGCQLDMDDLSDESVYRESPPSEALPLWFGTYSWFSEKRSPYTHWWVVDFEANSEFTFMKTGPTQETQLVVLQLIDFDYEREPGAPLDPTEVSYLGHTGFWYNGNVAFVVPIEIGTKYTIDRSTIDVPVAQYTVQTAPQRFEHSSHRYFWFSGVTNDTLNVTFNVTEWNPGVQDATNHYVDIILPPPDHFSTSLPRVSVGDTFELDAKVEVTTQPSLPSENVDEYCAEWNARIFQNVVTHQNHTVKWTSNYTAFSISPIPGYDPVEDEGSFTNCGHEVSLSVVDTPGDRQRPLWWPLAGRPNNPLTQITRDTTFVTWLAAEHDASGRIEYLKWVKWRVAYDVEYVVTTTNVATSLNTWTYEIITQGDGMGPHTPTFTGFTETPTDHPIP